MKFPLLGSTNVSNPARLLTLAIIVAAFSIGVVAQKANLSRGLAPENVGYRLEQCANGKRIIPQTDDPCDAGNDWVTGIVNSAKAHYIEGDSVPYRLIITGLTPNVPTFVTFSWDSTKGGKHAIDYITSYDRTENLANGSQAIPCADLNLAVCDPTDHNGSDQFQIPADPNYTAAGPNFPQDTAGEFITIWGGDITGLGRRDACDVETVTPDNVNPYRLCGSYAGTSVTDITVFFTPTTSDVVIAWGGHIARRADWGIDNGASSISGAPFHTGMITGGSRDVQMSLDAVLFPGLIKIIKEVTTTTPVGTSSTFQFMFSATLNSGLPQPSFFLVDDDNPATNAPADNIVNTDVQTFYVNNNAATEIKVTEANYTNVPPHHWTLTDIVCVDTQGGSQLPSTADSSGSILTRTATIKLQEGEFVTCTFKNSQNLAPTAAHASVSGRVVDAFGTGISGARFSVTNVQTGESYIAISNPFGYYTVDGMEVGNFYMMTISHKRYTFADDTRTFSLQDNISGMDFSANP